MSSYIVTVRSALHVGDPVSNFIQRVENELDSLGSGGSFIISSFVATHLLPGIFTAMALISRNILF